MRDVNSSKHGIWSATALRLLVSLPPPSPPPFLPSLFFPPLLLAASCGFSHFPMADRLQYPMHPTYSPALMHQQQQVQQQSQQIPSQQQPQQQLQDSHSSLPNFADNNRLWQHMQQMRSHAADLSSVQPNPQVSS